METNQYNKVYDFTNENVNCLKILYNFDNSKVLSVIGSGDQYFTSILNGAKKVDLFDINPTSYLYLILKFYSIRELTYEEFYDFLVLKNFDNKYVYQKLCKVLPVEVFKYYKYIMMCNKNEIFRKDGIDMLSRKNQKYYFKNNKSVIPYFIEENYYILKEKLKSLDLPNFFQVDLLNLKSVISENYDILLTSNIYDHIDMTSISYIKFLKDINIPKIQVCYDWFGSHLEELSSIGCSVDIVLPSSPSQYVKKRNLVYSLKNKK